MKLEVYNIEGNNVGREVELSEDIFGLELNDKLEHVVYLAVKQYNAHQRQGTHKSKERAEISGSTRKIKRQKGTGTARAGSIKSPLFRGGGRAFGPRPRTYSIKLNKKVKSLARKAVLSAKAQEGKVIVLEDFSFDAPKTKAFDAVLNAIKVDGNALAYSKTLMLLDMPAGPEKPTEPQRPYKPKGNRKQEIYNAAIKQYLTDAADYSVAMDKYEEALDEHYASRAKVYDNILMSSHNVPYAMVSTAKDFNVYQILNADYLVLSEGALNRINETLG